MNQHTLSNSLTILNINLRSLNTNFSIFKSFIAQIKCVLKIIVITETHTDSNTDNLYQLGGYRKASISRNLFGGGITVFIISSLDFEINEKFTGVHNFHETLFLTIKCPGLPSKSIQLLCAYIPSRNNMHEFVKYLGSLPKRIYMKNLILVGDFNLCPVRDRNSTELIALTTFLCTKNFSQLIDHPTYISYSGNPSILDHVWSNLNFSSISYVFQSPISDHIPTITSYEIPMKLPKQTQRFRDFSVKRLNHFEITIVSHISNLINAFPNIIDSDNIQELEKCFYLADDWLKKECNSYFPIMKKIVSHERANSPWLTTPIIKLINKKHTLFSLLRSDQIALETYSSYCKGLKKLLFLCENNFHRNKLNAVKFDSRKKWAHINSLMGRSKNNDVISLLQIGEITLNDSITITFSLNDFFLELPYNLRAKIQWVDYGYDELIKRNPNSIFFKPVTTEEIEQLIKNMRKNSNVSDIPVKFLKLTSSLISPILKDLFNKCIELGYFPDQFKLSTVTAILKAGNGIAANNRRPISILNPLSIIFEKLMHDRIYSFVEHDKLLSIKQFGFRKQKSTSQANIQLLNEGLKALKHENYTLSVYLDFSKAFDCVGHPRLISKLEKYGIRGNVLALMKSYLSGRRQRVRNGTHFSSEKFIDIGVPQGSVLGPLLYLIYANDINNILNDVQVISYADDIVLIINGSNLEDLVLIMNRALINISKWCIYNMLTLNPDKSKCMVFSNRAIQFIGALTLNDKIIEIVSLINYLGITLDKKLSLTHHLTCVNDKLSQISGISWKLTNKFNVNTARVFYYSFAYSRLCYGIEVWGGIFLTHACHRTFSLHRRIILNLFAWHFPGDDYVAICHKMKLLDIISIYKLNLMVLFYNILNNNYLPSIKFHEFDSGYCTRNQTEFRASIPRTNVIKMHFEYQMPIIWNTVPLKIRRLDSAQKFKTSYKTYLLNGTVPK